MEIKNLKKAAKRIKKAIENKEKIILYGDADLDGIASVIILKETIKSLAGSIAAIYFPDREKEGYGITKMGLNFLKNFSPALFVTLDLGIGNFEEVKLAKKLGFEVIIIDHHQVLQKIPQASIVVDPKQEDDKYPFKGLATAGIVFKLVPLILKEKFSQSLKKNFLELVALATIADLMPRTNENRIFIEEGIESLKNTWRPGLKALLEINSIKNYQNFQQIVQRVVSCLNVSETKNHLTCAYLILTQKNEKEAEILAEDLLEKRNIRKGKIREIITQLEERISEKIDEPLIFDGATDWPVKSLGSVASRICNEYQKPTFLFQKGKNKSQGAVRMPKGLDGVKAMANCSNLLETYGGHAPACGFRLKNENLEAFKKCLIGYFKKL